MAAEGAEHQAGQRVLRDYFTKKGGGKKLLSGSKKRWFVLEGDAISYFEKPDQKKQTGNIYLQQIQSVKVSGKELVLVTAFRDYSLTADKAEKASEWAEEIETRLRDQENLRKIVTMAEKITENAEEIETNQRELRRYINHVLEANKNLKIENARLKLKVEELHSRNK